MILDPLSVVTGSLDGSARVFSLDGSQLGVLIDQNETETAPWIFEPPTTGRKREASARAAALHGRLDIVRRTQRRQVSEVSGDKKSRKNPRVPTTFDEELPPSIDAPVNYSALPSSVLDARKRDGRGIRGEGGVEPPPNESPAADTRREIDRLDGRSALSAACLSRINEVTHPTGTAPSEDSDTASGGQNSHHAPQESIDARLMNEAREAQRYQPADRASSSNRPSTSTRVAVARGARHLGDDGEIWRRSGGEILSHKTPANLHAEKQRKHMKRTRSALQFLSDEINRTGGHGLGDVVGAPPPGQSRQTPAWAVAGGCFEAGTRCDSGRGRNRTHTGPSTRAEEATTTASFRQEEMSKAASTVGATDGATPLRVCSSAPVLRDAVAKMAPLFDLRLGSSGRIPLTREKREAAGRKMLDVPLSQRSTAMSARALRSPRTNVAISSDFRVRLHADRRRRHIDRIIFDVGQIEKNNEGVGSPEYMVTTTTKCITADETNSSSRPSSAGVTLNEVDTGVAGREEYLSPMGHPMGVLSDRVQNVLSRFERLVHGGSIANGLRRSSHDGGRHTDTVLEKRLREKRTAARKSAIRHNERYRRAQRFNLNAMKQTQQRRQEATVGLSGPSGERFGPYSLEDVFDFQAFASHLGALGAELLTVRGLMNNPGIQDDPYTHALLQELARTRVVHWNQALSLEDLMQVHEVKDIIVRYRFGTVHKISSSVVL